MEERLADRVNDYCVAAGLNNTYKALRLIGNDYDLSYTVWCTNEHELYDLKVRVSEPSALSPFPFTNNNRQEEYTLTRAPPLR